MFQAVRTLGSNNWAKKVRDLISDFSTNSDPNFYRSPEISGFVEDSGTSHVSVLAPNGDAVSVTSTVNNVFGSGEFRKCC